MKMKSNQIKLNHYIRAITRKKQFKSKNNSVDKQNEQQLQITDFILNMLTRNSYKKRKPNLKMR